MASDSTPWFVGGGAHHAPEVARGSLYDSTGGAEGVSAPGSLKVEALTPTGKGVRILPGGALMLNRYPGGSLQTYSARWLAQQTLEGTQHFPDTPSGSGRTDLVVARILDPQYEGNPPADPNAFEYRRFQVIQNVSSSIERAEQLNLGYPAIALARITRPAGTGHIQASHITDLRRLARPRTLRRVLAGTGQSGLAISNEGNWNGFPGYNPSIEVPRWATHAIILAQMEAVSHVNPGTVGEWRVKLGSKLGTVTFFDISQQTEAGWDRVSLSATAELDVRDVAGTVQALSAEGRRTSGYTGYLATKSGTRMTFDVQFEERTV